MRIKKISAFILCALLALSCSACKKASGDLSSNFTSSVNTSQINSNFNSTPTTTSSTVSSSSQNTETSSKNTTVSSNDSQGVDSLEEKYGFSSLESVKYKCISDIPNGDAVYEITTVFTNRGSNINYMCDITCKEKSIVIDNATITVPYEYRKNHDSISLTATHRFAKMSCDFTITFDKWEVVFEDNFDGTELNTKVWNVWDNQRDNRYSYSKDAMFLDGKGNLINRMSVLKTPDTVTGESKISGAITTIDTFKTTYGYFEIRMIPHRAAGLMGAFWLVCGDMSDENCVVDYSAVNGCEIDIIETFYNKKNPSHTIHWDGYGTYTNDKGEKVKKTQSYYFNNQGRDDVFDGQYHTFSFFWTPQEYIFLIDGEITGRTDLVGICNQPGYLLISSHFNSEAGELPIVAGKHTDMIVDYVKVYKNNNY